MEDTPDNRAEIAWLLNDTKVAERVGIGRFRRHTLGSRIGNVVDKVVDEFAGPEGGEGTAGRDAPCGMHIWVDANGECLHEWDVHPIQDDFEQSLLPLAVSTARRLGASFEVYVDDEAVFSLDKSWWRSQSGYRNAPKKGEPPALPSERYAWTHDGMTYHHRWSPTFWAMPIMALLLVGCFPIVVLAMLFGETRRVLTGLTKSIFLGGEVRWSWTRLGGTWTFDLKAEEAPAAVSLSPQEVLLFLPMPWRWSKPAGECRTVWAVRERDAVELPLATDMDARLIAGVLAENARSAS